MYLDFFGLECEPFTISPDPVFLYPSPQHRKALAHLKYGLDREGGFILLTGEVGTGKTTLTRLLLEQLPGNVRVAYILNAKLNSHDVLASVCTELGLDFAEEHSDKTLTDLIYKDLLAAHSIGKKTLLVLEEAQNLDPDVLETLRLLTNLETNTTKLLHILLVGQPELLDLIARKELRQLNQRVVSRFHIEPLDLIETGHYVRHRLKKAGASSNPFDVATVKKLHQLSGGIPRMLNLIAERSLLGAYATGMHQVSPAIVMAAHEEVFGGSLTAKGPESSSKSARKLIAVAAIFVLVCFAAYFTYSNFFSLGTPAISSSSESQNALANHSPLSLSERPPEPLEANEEDLPDVLQSDDIVSEDLTDVLDMQDGYEEQAEEFLVPVETMPQALYEPVASLNAYQQLADLWGLQAEVQTRLQLCAEAGSLGLLCHRDEELTFRDLQEINLPGLAVLSETEESSVLYFVSDMSDRLVNLSNSTGDRAMSIEEFEQQWTSEYLYLWPAPTSYSGLLTPGSKNPELVGWLQDQLSQVYNSYEVLLVGGIYSQTISDYVAEFQSLHGLEADGLLGPRTILRLIQETDETSLPLLVEESS